MGVFGNRLQDPDLGTPTAVEREAARGRSCPLHRDSLKMWGVYDSRGYHIGALLLKGDPTICQGFEVKTSNPQTQPPA